ncbi:MAG: hypothetical protein K8S20_11745 [Chloroflexi bacterium]|nr:hypothetical protein [Chloroflexota bacterium]
MKQKRYIVLISLLLIASVLLAACGDAAGTDTVAQPSSPETNGNDGSVSAPIVDFVLDPANANNEDALGVIGHLYEGLVSSQSGTMTGVLAESYSLSEDGLDYIFNLRPGVSFHDGSTLNADLVIANFNRWFDPQDANRGSGKFAAWAENFGGFKGETNEDGKSKSEYDGIEKVNDLIILVHLNSPDPDFLNKMAGPAFVIASPNSFKNNGDGGSGPYMVTAKTDTGLTLSPFAGYWNSSAIPGADLQVPFK